MARQVTLRVGPPSGHRPPSSGGRPTLRAGPGTRCSAFAELILLERSRSAAEVANSRHLACCEAFTLRCLRRSSSRESAGGAGAAPPPTLRVGPPSGHRPPSSGGRPTLRAGPGTRCSAFAELISHMSSRSVDKPCALMRAQRTPLRPGPGSNRFPHYNGRRGPRMRLRASFRAFRRGPAPDRQRARPRRNAHPKILQ